MEVLEPRKQWTYSFDETGGYDCMSSAFVITNGSEQVVVDGKDFGWYEFWIDNPMAKARMLVVAETICQALNKELI